MGRSRQVTGGRNDRVRSAGYFIPYVVIEVGIFGMYGSQQNAETSFDFIGPTRGVVGFKSRSSIFVIPDGESFGAMHFIIKSPRGLPEENILRFESLSTIQLPAIAPEAPGGNLMLFA